LVVEELLERVPAADVVAITRRPQELQGFAERGSPFGRAIFRRPTDWLMRSPALSARSSSVRLDRIPSLRIAPHLRQRRKRELRTCIIRRC